MQLSNKEHKAKIKWNRQFKGVCYNYGELGNQASECIKPKKKSYRRQQKCNVKCYICGGNHYATDCLQKKQSPEQAHMFVGVTHIIRDKQMKEKIIHITDINKLKPVNTMCGDMSVNQLFQPEGNKAINPQVLMMVNQLLNNQLKQDNNILKIEYNNYMKEKMKEGLNKESIKSTMESDMKSKECG